MKLSGRHKRETADARSRLWRRRFYDGAAIATVLYVVLSIITFHGHLTYLPYELSLTWAVFLLCYTSFKEVLRWNNLNDTEPYRGEMWAGLVLAGALWMIAWNIGREWIFHLPHLPFPMDYEAATIETIVLYTLSIMSSIIYKRRNFRQGVHHRARNKVIHGEEKVLTLGPSRTTSKPSENSEPKAVLTKAEKQSEENTPKVR